MIYNLAQVVNISEQVVLPRMNVKEVKRQSSWQLLPPVLLFVVLLAQLTIRVQIIGQGYALEELRAQAVRSDAVLRDTKLKLAYATRPRQLVEKASKELGMVTLCPQRIRQS